MLGRAEAVQHEAEDAREDERLAPPDRAVHDRGGMTGADDERDAEEGDPEQDEGRTCRADPGPPPEDERREERPQRDDERGGLRPRMREPRVGEQVEAGEAERAEPEEPPASPLETERAGAFDHGEHHEPQRRRDRVPDRRQGEGVHALERRLAHDELAAPHDRGRRREEHSQRGRPRPHRSPLLDCDNKRFQRPRQQQYFGDRVAAAGVGKREARVAAQARRPAGRVGRLGPRMPTASVDPRATDAPFVPAPVVRPSGENAGPVCRRDRGTRC